MTVDGAPPDPRGHDAPHAGPALATHPSTTPAGRRAGAAASCGGEHRAMVTLASLTMAGCARYPGAAGHLIRTAHIAACLADLMALDATLQQRIRLVTPVHDVGKLAIPDEILLKPGRLAPDEWRTMERHTEIGAEALASGSHELLQFAAMIARHHHERFDGSGYPARLAGHGIPLAARVVAVADAFDAMTETRCYRPRMTDDDACSIIAGGSGTHFDPEAVRAFLDGFAQVRRARATADALLARGSDTQAVSDFYRLAPQDFRLAARVASRLAQHALRLSVPA